MLFHELSHELGAEHTPAGDHPDLLNATLIPGQRRLPSTEDLDQIFANGNLLADVLK